MPRLAPRLFTLCSAVSLLLCVACVTAWLTSRVDLVAVADGKLLVVCGGRGADEYVALHRQWHLRSSAAVWRRLRGEAGRKVAWRERAGFGYGSGTLDATVHSPRLGDASRSMTFSFTLVAGPLWAATLAFAAVPVAWATVRIRRARRASSGQCAACGCDLRAIPERCPECGTTAGKVNA